MFVLYIINVDSPPTQDFQNGKVEKMTLEEIAA